MSSTVAGEKVIHPVARRWTRHKLDVPIRVIVHLEDKSRVISGRGKEISEGGMAVFAGVELHVGDKIEIEFTPPHSCAGNRQKPQWLQLWGGIFCGQRRAGCGKGTPARRPQ